MKKSELKITGDSYRTTPTSWGDTSIMIDEDAAVENMRECGFEVESPDDDENDRPIEIAVDSDGVFYAIQPAWEKTSWGRSTGETNPELYIQCENPAEASNGLICVFGTWHEFDDDDDDTNAMEHLVSDQNGVYCYHVLAKNFPLFVEYQQGIKTELSDFLLNNSDIMGAHYTKDTVFHPDTAEWCENLEYLENLGLFVRADNGDYWRIESIEGTIWAINPKAEWNEEEDTYTLGEE